MGTVYSAVLKCSNSIDLAYLPKEFAIKQIDSVNDDIDGNDCEAAALEIVSGHENVVTYHGLVIEAPFKYIVMEKVQGPSVFGLLQRGFMLFEIEALQVMQDIFKALEFIHYKGVAHLDIKAENVVFTSDISDDDYELPSVKLIDFGLAVSCESANIGICGTPGYIAPEILSGKDLTSYAPADIWSSGVLLYELLTGSLPYESGITKKMMKTGIVPKLSARKEKKLNTVTNETRRFLMSCLASNPKERPTAKTALAEVTFNIWTHGWTPQCLGLTTLAKIRYLK